MEDQRTLSIPERELISVIVLHLVLDFKKIQDKLPRDESLLIDAAAKKVDKDLLIEVLDRLAVPNPKQEILFLHLEKTGYTLVRATPLSSSAQKTTALPDTPVKSSRRNVLFGVLAVTALAVACTAQTYTAGPPRLSSIFWVVCALVVVCVLAGVIWWRRSDSWLLLPPESRWTYDRTWGEVTAFVIIALGILVLSRIWQADHPSTTAWLLFWTLIALTIYTVIAFSRVPWWAGVVCLLLLFLIFGVPWISIHLPRPATVIEVKKPDLVLPSTPPPQSPAKEPVKLVNREDVQDQRLSLLETKDLEKGQQITATNARIDAAHAAIDALGNRTSVLETTVGQMKVRPPAVRSARPAPKPTGIRKWHLIGVPR